MHKKKKLLVDMDGIIADFFTPLFRDYKRLTGETVVMDQILGWDMAKYVGQGEVLIDLFHQPGFFLKLKPLPGAIWALKRLSKRYDIIIASYACTPSAASEKVSWCKKHLPFISIDSLILCHRKELIRGDAIIDDGLHNAMGYRAAWPDSLVLGIAYPYNEDKKKVFNFRVDGYKHTLKAWRKLVRIIEKNL